MTSGWTHDPKLWIEFPIECLWYLFPGLFFHTAALTLSIAFCLLLRLFRCRWLKLSTVFIFHAFLLSAAMFANGIWSCMVWGRLYWSNDYISDFSAFFPIQHYQISWDENSEALNGIGFAQLHHIWLILASGTWLFTIFATWKFCRYRALYRKNQIADDSPPDSNSHCQSTPHE